MRIDKNKLLLTEAIEFPFPVSKYILNQDKVLVLLDIPKDIIFNENVYCVGLDGNIIWQISKQDYLYDNSPFVNIRESNDGSIWIVNWDGSQYAVDIDTGDIIKKSFHR